VILTCNCSVGNVLCITYALFTKNLPGPPGPPAPPPKLDPIHIYGIYFHWLSSVGRTWFARAAAPRACARQLLDISFLIWYTYGLFIWSEDSLPSAQRYGVFAYQKQKTTVSVGSFLKWRARPQYLRSKVCLCLADEQHISCFICIRCPTFLSRYRHIISELIYIYSSAAVPVATLF
jgi:hypothetical protein